MKNSIKKLSLILFLLFLGTIVVACGNNTPTPKPPEGEVKEVKVRLNEVVRSIFYAPMYAAISEGFFEEEGIEIELSTGQGADKTMQQLLSGSADIGFSGPEQVIYIYNQGREDYPILFANLTQKDGSFLVAREENNNFSWEDVKGKTIIGGRPGGMPQMSLEYVLKNKGIDITKDVEVLTNIATNLAGGAFQGGTGDFVALFEPTGSLIEKEGTGYIVASIGEAAGTFPYTSFYTTKSYLENNKDVVERFTRAIYKAQTWVLENTDEAVAKSIISFFPGTDEDLVARVVKNLRAIEAFAPDPSFKEADVTRLMDIIESYDKELLPKRPSFEDIVNNEFSTKVINDTK